MAFSVSNALPASSSSNNISCLDGKKSLFLLKKIIALTELGYKTLNDNELNNTAGNVIHIYLSLPHQDSDSIKKELQGLKLVQANLASYSLKEIFHAALSEVTGINQSSLAKTQEIYLNQIYTEQFLTWIQEEIEDLPAFSILLLLNIYHSFGDPAVGLDTSIWQELLSIKGWSASQKRSLNQFKSKYESLNFYALKSSFIKIENTIHLAEATGDIKKLKDSYILWSRVVELLINHLEEDQEKYFVRYLNKNKKLIREDKKTPDREFIIHAKKMISGFLSKFEQARKEYNAKIFKNSTWTGFIQECLKKEDDTLQRVQTQVERALQKSLKEVDEEVQKIQNGKSELENCLQKIQDVERETNSFNIMGEEKQKLLYLIEIKDQALQKISESRGKLIKKNQETVSAIKTHNPNNPKIDLLKKDQKEMHNTLTLREKSLSSILFLSQWLVNLLEKEDQLISQLEQEERIAYEAAVKKSKGSFKKHSASFSKKSPDKSDSFAEDFSITSENTSGEDSEEEPSISSFSESSDSILENIDSFNEINMYLMRLKEGKNTQLNGFLIQAVDSLLKTLKAHLLKMKAADDLKDLYDLQTKEIYDHLLLGTAGLELIMQAVHDQRTDHIVLGFRAALLHCYYAIEQKLSQRIILETNKALDKVDQDHNLLHLAQKAKIANVKKWEQFLQEMTLHLTFSYPEDYRLFFQQESEQKAFSLLDDLSGSNLDKKKIKEAIEFCFEMYSKSIVFITEISSVQIENQPKILHVMQELKKQIVSTLYEPSAKKILLAQSVLQLKEPDPVLVRVQQMLSVLHPFLKNLDPLNQPYADERDQRIYTALGTVQSYLKLMEISLEIPQNSSHHSLQKFIKLETIANIDKLFKHLFRGVILLGNGEDNHQHTLTSLFTLVADFYQKDNEQDVYSFLKKINLGISHHYLHIAWNNSELHSIYNNSLVQAYSLLNVSNGFTVVNKKINKSEQGLQKNINRISELVSQSLDLFMEFLEPTLAEIKERVSITAVA